MTGHAPELQRYLPPASVLAMSFHIKVNSMPTLKSERFHIKIHILASLEKQDLAINPRTVHDGSQQKPKTAAPSREDPVSMVPAPARSLSALAQ